MLEFFERFIRKSEVSTQALTTQTASELLQGIQVEALDLTKDLDRVADLYANVFAAPPWNEYTKCDGCSSFSGRETQPGEVCPHCQNNTLQVAYPHDETIGLVQEAGARPNASMFVARRGEDILGFVWGYTHPSMEDLLESKSGYSPEARSQIVEVLNEHNVNFPIFYFAEIGIDDEARGQGLSHILVEKLVTRARELNQPLLMTTNWKTRMIPVAKRFGMKLILGPESYYDKSTDSVVRTGKVAHAIDAEREDRTLFLLEQQPRITEHTQRRSS